MPFADVNHPFPLVSVAAEFVTVFVFNADFHPTPRPILIVPTSAVAISVGAV